MQEQLDQVFRYVWGVWRFRWLALVCTWILAVGGWISVYMMPDSYVASARLFVDSNTVLAPLLKGLAIQPPIEQRVTMMSRTLLSRPNLEKIMRMTDLDLQVDTDIARERLIASLQQRTELSGQRGNASIYSISFTDPDRDVAKRVVQAMTTVFIESSLGGKREDSAEAREFLEAQIEEYEKRLVSAEDRLAEFKRRNVDVLPGTGGDFYQRLEETRMLQRAAQLELSEVLSQRDELRRQLTRDGADNGEASTEARNMANLDDRIYMLQIELDTLLANYTEKHPEVRQLKSLIETMQSERADFAASIQESGVNVDDVASEIAYEEVRAKLAELEASSAGLQFRVQEYGRRVLELEDKVSNIPLIEAELKRLDRDYGVVRQQHEELMQRRESASLSGDVEKNSDVSFRVIDPPFVPLVPTKPNKLLLSIAAFFGALGAGLGVSLLMSVVKPVVSSQRELAESTGLPVFGSVAIQHSTNENRHRLLKLALYFSLFTTLVVAYSGMTVIQYLAVGT